MDDHSSSRFGLARIGQMDVPVRDVDRAVAFYRDTLGMRLLFQAPPGLAFFDCGGVRLMLDGPAKAQADTHSSVVCYAGSEPPGRPRDPRGPQRGLRGAPHLIAKLPDHDLFEQLKSTVGTAPAAVLAAKPKALERVTPFLSTDRAGAGERLARPASIMIPKGRGTAKDEVSRSRRHRA